LKDIEANQLEVEFPTAQWQRALILELVARAAMPGAFQ
jgi:hypothetical protein